MRYASAALFPTLLFLMNGFGWAAGTPPVNTDDARLALQISSGLAPSAAPDATRADVASPWGPEPDGRISILDALRLLRAANGLDTVPEGGSGFLSLNDHIDLRTDVERTYILPRALLFRARIMDEAGQPLYGHILVTSEQGAMEQVKYTGRAGEFATGLNPGKYEARVSTNLRIKDPKTGEYTNITLTRKGVEALNVHSDTEHVYATPAMPPLGTVEGVIRGEGFQPLFLSMSVTSDGSNKDYVSANCQNGVFRLQVPAGVGRMEIHGNFPGEPNLSLGASVDREIAITAGQTTRVEIDLPMFSRVEGRVVDPSGGHVRTVSFFTPYTNGSTAPRYTSTLAQNATFDYTDFVAAIPPGPYEVTVEMDGGEPAERVRKTYRTLVTVPDAPAPLTVSIPAVSPMRTFSGRVVGPSGKPLAKSEIFISPDQYTEGVEATIDAWLFTDDDGRFHATLPEGEYTISVQPAPVPS